MTMREDVTGRSVEGRDTTSSSAGSTTHDGLVGWKYIPLDVVRIVAPILEALARSRDPRVNSEVIRLVEDLVGLLSQLAKVNVNVSNLPSLYGTSLDDGSFLIEWLSPNYRVGFVVEANPDKSMWYLIMKADSVELNSSGSLAGHSMMSISAVLSQWR